MPDLPGPALFPDITCDDIFRLETPRLWLRWLRAADAAALTTFASLSDVARMTASIPHPYPPGEAQRYILHARGTTAAGQALILAVTLKNKARSLVGLVSAQVVDRHRVEIGYAVAPTHGGRGYATESAAALIDAVFNLTDARIICADTRVTNPASRRVLEKCGFTFTGAALKDLPARGGRHPCDTFERHRRDWMRGRDRRLPAMMQQTQRAIIVPDADGSF